MTFGELEKMKNEPAAPMGDTEPKKKKKHEISDEARKATEVAVRAAAAASETEGTPKKPARKKASAAK